MPLRLLLPLLVLAAACSPAQSADSGTPAVVASVYPLAWLAETIAPEADVTFLAASGQDPHDLELSPQQRAAVERADVALYLGQIGFQPQVEDALAGRAEGVVDAATVLDGKLRTIEVHAGGADEEHAGEGAVDAHLWFDATLMVDLAAATGEAFAQADPANGDTYLANAEQAAEEMTRVATDVEALLTDCEHDEIIVSHEAYAYLVGPHGLTQHGISGAGGHGGASPGDITRLVAQVRAEGIPAVLSEPVEGRTDAEVVAAEAGIELLEILSLDIVDETQAAKGFPALLREQAEAVARAAQCTGVAVDA